MIRPLPAPALALLLLGSALIALNPAVARSQDEPRAAGTDVPVPKRTKFVQPQYPAEALALGLRGIVILALTIDPTGKVSAVDVIRSLPPFDDPAVAAARQWEYEVTKVGGKPVRVRLTVPITFALKLPEIDREAGIPELRQGVAPPFPADAPSHETASVTAGLTVDPSGQVVEAEIKSGRSPWSEALLQALRTWRFTPPGGDHLISFQVRADFVASGRGTPRVDLKLAGLHEGALIQVTHEEPVTAASPASAPASPPAPEAAPAPGAGTETPASSTPHPPDAAAPATQVAGSPQPQPTQAPASGSQGEPVTPPRQPTTPEAAGAPPAGAEPAAPSQPAASPATPPAQATPPSSAAPTPPSQGGTPPSAGPQAQPVPPRPGAPPALPPAPPVEIIPPSPGVQPAPAPTPTPRPMEPGVSAVQDVVLSAGVPDLSKGRRPVAPPLARMNGVSGSVEVRFIVEASGTTSVREVSGPDLLKEAARQTVASWVFRRTTAERLPLAAVFSYLGDTASASVKLVE